MIPNIDRWCRYRDHRVRSSVRRVHVLADADENALQQATFVGLGFLCELRGIFFEFFQGRRADHR